MQFVARGRECLIRAFGFCRTTECDLFPALFTRTGTSDQLTRFVNLLIVGFGDRECEARRRECQAA